MRQWLAGATLVLASALVGTLNGAQTAPARRPARPSAAAVPAVAFLKQYCLGCHNDRAKVGRLSLESLDATSMTFVLRGVTVSYSGAVFSRGTQSDLANGSQVEVKGTLSVDGTTVQASSISFEH